MPEQHHTLFINDLSNIDLAIFEPSVGVIGQTWNLSLELSGPLSPVGFVYDFSPLKALIKQVLRETIDHALLIPVTSPAVRYSENGDSECWQLRAQNKMQGLDFLWEYECPKGAVFPFQASQITRPAVEKELTRILKHRLGNQITGLKIRLSEEKVHETTAFFRYTHGLSKHDGRCQRLFHGHRSRIEILINHERRADLEHFVCRELLGPFTHIASPDQLKKGEIEARRRGLGNDAVVLDYTSKAGYFRCVVPRHWVYMLSGQTSIEKMAEDIAAVLFEKESGRQIVEVTVFEGVGKGGRFRIDPEIKS